jgi:hypothetical protein
MKTVLKVAALLVVGVVALMLDVEVRPDAPLGLEIRLVPQAHAILGTRRRSFRRGVVVGASMADEGYGYPGEGQAQQPQAAPATAPPPTSTPPQATDKPLPIGTVVQALPAGCTSTPVGGVEYYYCGGNFYRAVFQGNQLVYVTAKP